MNALCHILPGLSTLKPKVYSYTRFSTSEQAAGDSSRRQSDAAAKWAGTEGLGAGRHLSA